MKKFLRIFITALILTSLLTLLSCYVEIPDTSNVQDSSIPSIDDSGIIRIDAKALYKAYSENPIRADISYKNKILELTGKVSSILDDGTVCIEAGGFLASIYCKFDYLWVADVANINRGQVITVQGICNGNYAFNSVLLEGCKIIS
ncbi:hypothetical protein ABFB50_06570 [Dehalococcoides sp. THU3]|uniref:OB-fold protein n=1 Tax=Dehalococcoides TaxID=61434 RepID=UPI0026E94DBA|nr:hypothetical protein [Dehalococcoides mccartyi]